MTTTLDLQAKTHGSRVLADWAASRPGAAARMGQIRNDVTDSTQIIKSSDPQVLELFGVGRAAAGVAVTPESAMRVAAVFRAVTLISGAIASLPIHVYRRTATGRERVNDSPLWWLLNERPTDRYSAASHWEGVGANTQLRGDSFTFIGRSRSGTMREFIPMPWASARVERDQSSDGSRDRLKYFFQDGLRTWGADQDDVLHFPGFGFNGLRGMSVIQSAARNAAGTAMAMDEYSGQFFSGGAHPSIVLESPTKMSKGLIEDLQESFAKKYSGMHNAHKLPLILTEGIKANSLSLSAEDAQLLDARKFQVIDIARAFGVPPHLIGETSAATSWGSGMEELGKAFVIFTLNPHLVRIEQELNAKLFRTAGMFIEFNRDALLQGNSEGQSKVFRAALGGPGQGPGYMTTDEVRALKNLPPLGGRCAEVYFPPEKAATTAKESSSEDPEPTPAAA